MLPQQTMDSIKSETPNNEMPIFGSQLVSQYSSTPYSDATQVGSVFVSVSAVINLDN